MSINAYRDFVIKAQTSKKNKSGIQELSVEVIDSPVGEGGQSYSQLAPPELKSRIEEFEDDNLAIDRVKETGKILAELLLPNKIHTLLTRSLDKLESDQGLRLRMRLDPSLTDIPWEFMSTDLGSGSDFLVLDRRISIVRHQEIPISGDLDATPKPRRILIALANPRDDDYPKLDLAREKKNIEKALRDLDGIVPEFINNATEDELNKQLLRDADIFHFAGHGFFEEAKYKSKEGRGGIVLVTKSGEPFLLSAGTLSKLLQSCGVKLVVLGACQTGRRDGKNTWNSVAPALMKVGIPAAIAMQFAILDENAVKFSSRFYETLAAGLPVDRAVFEGRLAVFSYVESLRDDPNHLSYWRDWGVPVLYLRAKQDFKLPAIADAATGKDYTRAPEPPDENIETFDTEKKAPTSVDVSSRIISKDYAITLQPPSQVAKNIKKFTGRTWLLTHLVNWFEKLNARTFVIQGGPGTGKSTIIAWLSGKGTSSAETAASDQLQNISSHVKAVYYFKYDGFNLRPTSFAETINKQLRQNIKEFEIADSGEHSVKRYIGNVDDEASFNIYLRKPLRKLYDNGYDKPIILLLDELDKSLNYTGAINVVQLLAKLFTDLPAKVRLVVTTSPDKQELKSLGNAIDLLKDAPINVNDIQGYVYERLGKSDKGKPDEERRNRLAIRISNAAEGSFLYADKIIDYFALSNPPQVFDFESMALPQGLQRLYQTFLKRTTENDVNFWKNSLESVFGIIAVARGEGLSRVQIERIIGKQVERELEICKPFLEMPNGPFFKFHQSFSAFLLEDKSNGDYHIAAAPRHRQIGTYYWNIYQNNWLICDDVYGLNNLATHLFKSDDSERWQKLQALMSKEWMLARIMKCDFDYKGFLSDIETGWQLALAKKNVVPLGLLQLQILRQIQASLHTDTDLKTLVKVGRKNEALHYVGMRDLVREKFYGLLTVYHALKEIDQANNELSAGLKKLADAIPEENHRKEAHRALEIPLPQSEENYAKEDFEDWLAFARINPDLSKRATELCNLAAAMKKAGDTDASTIFQAAREAANTIENLSQRTSILREIAATMARCGEQQAGEVFDQAIELAYVIEGYKYRTEALGAVAVTFISAKRLNEANQVLGYLQYDNQKELVMPKIVAAYGNTNADGINKALDLIKAMQDFSRQAEALIHLAMVLAKADDKRAVEKFGDAHKLINSIQDGKEKITLFRKLAVALMQAHDNRSSAMCDEAIKMAGFTGDLVLQVSECCELAMALRKSDARRALSMLDDAMAISRSLKDMALISALCKLAVAYERFDSKRTSEIVKQIRESIDGMQKESDRELSMRYLAETMIEINPNNEAEKIITSIQDETIKSSPLRKLADNLATQGSFTEALIKLGARSIDEYLLILAEWSPCFEKVKSGMSLKVLQEATEVAGWLRPDWQKVHELISNNNDGK